jgi:regulator of RNase E activity RraA
VLFDAESTTDFKRRITFLTPEWKVNVDGELNTTLGGINKPTHIGKVTVTPGDVVLGRDRGVIFLPPHLAEKVVKTSEVVRLRDMFGHQRLHEQKYTPGRLIPVVG